MNEPTITTPATTPSPPKSIFKSKTIFAGALVALAGACGSVWPDADKFIAANASVILLVAGALQMVLRVATKGRLVLFAE